MDQDNQRADSGRIELLLINTGQVLDQNGRSAILLQIALRDYQTSDNSIGEDAMQALELLDLSQLPHACQIIAVPNMLDAPHNDSEPREWTASELIAIASALSIVGARGKEAESNTATAILLDASGMAQMIYPGIDNGHISDQLNVQELFAQPTVAHASVN